MKRAVLLVVVLAAVAAFASAPAGASVPCRDRIYNDWYPDGKIGTNYPIACYRDAIKHVRADARVYSSLVDDIRAAMQAALARLHGHTSVPEQVGKGGKPQPVANTDPTSTSPSTTPHDPASHQVTTSTVPVTTVAAGKTDGGSSVPLPLLVLGALALLLVAAGGAGLVAKRRRESS